LLRSFLSLQNRVPEGNLPRRPFPPQGGAERRPPKRLQNRPDEPARPLPRPVASVTDGGRTPASGPSNAESAAVCSTASHSLGRLECRPITHLTNGPAVTPMRRIGGLPSRVRPSRHLMQDAIIGTHSSTWTGSRWWMTVRRWVLANGVRAVRSREYNTEPSASTATCARGAARPCEGPGTYRVTS